MQVPTGSARGDWRRPGCRTEKCGSKRPYSPIRHASGGKSRTRSSAPLTFSGWMRGVCFLSLVFGSVERMFDRVVDDNVEWVPANLEEVPPGCVLGAMLDDIDLNGCSGFDRIRVLQAHERMQAHYAARSFHAMAAIADTLKNNNDDDDGFVDEGAEAGAVEIAAALRLTRRSADTKMVMALELQRRLPRVWGLLCDGVIDVCRAQIMVNDTLHVSVATARGVVDRVIDDACLLTTGQLKAKLRKLCIEVDPDSAKDRYERAVGGRRVVTEATVDGTANLHALDLPPDRVAAARRHINQLALRARCHGDTRTIDQIRADVLLDLLDGTTTTRPGQALVEVITDLTALTRLTETPGHLAGYGPVIADIARQVTERQLHTPWQWTVTHPDTGMPIATGTTKRRPTPPQRRIVETRDRSCIHPGCRMPSTDCDLDHTISWAETKTTDIDNLAPLCRYHHRIKHQHGWRYDPLAEAEFGKDKLEPRLWRGDYLFTTPLGHTYTTSGRSP